MCIEEGSENASDGAARVAPMNPMERELWIGYFERVSGASDWSEWANALNESFRFMESFSVGWRRDISRWEG